MDVPEWAKPILLQFPIATLALGFLALGVWWLNKRHREEFERQERKHDEFLRSKDGELKRIEKDILAIRENHLGELNRMNALYREQIAKLHERVRELESRSTGRRT